MTRRLLSMVFLCCICPIAAAWGNRPQDGSYTATSTEGNPPLTFTVADDPARKHAGCPGQAKKITDSGGGVWIEEKAEICIIFPGGQVCFNTYRYKKVGDGTKTSFNKEGVNGAKEYGPTQPAQVTRAATARTSRQETGAPPAGLLFRLVQETI